MSEPMAGRCEDAAQRTCERLVEEFRAHGVAEADLKAEYLVAEAVGCERLGLALRAEVILSPAQLAILEEQARRMRGGEPLAYVLGHTSFMGYRIRTDPRALIPRPETEELAERVIATAGLGGLAGPVMADVGTGTGCIAIALAARFPRLRVWAIDPSEEALALAAENVEVHGLCSQVRLLRSDLFAAWPAGVRADAVVSNPPYISAGDHDGLPEEIRCREPGAALRAGARGLDVIERLIPGAYAVLRPRGSLYLEIGATQSDEVCTRMRDHGFQCVEADLDLAGHPRIVQGRKG